MAEGKSSETGAIVSVLSGGAAGTVAAVAGVVAGAAEGTAGAALMTSRLVHVLIWISAASFITATAAVLIAVFK